MHFYVSVVIPYYNGAETIDRALQCLEKQSIQPTEVIIVDDGSPEPLDESILDNRKIRIRVIRHPNNQGIPVARNSGIKVSCGEWVAFLDQDDVWLPGKLESQLRVVEKGFRGLIFSRCAYVDKNGIPRDPYPVRFQVNKLVKNPDLAARTLLLYGNLIPWSSVLIHKDVFNNIGLLNEEFVHGSDDYEFVLRAAIKGIHFKFAPSDDFTSYEVIHFITGKNFSRQDRFFKDNIKIIADIGANFPWLAKECRHRRAQEYFLLARYQMICGYKEKAQSLFLESIKTNPNYVFAYAGLILSMISNKGKVFRLAEKFGRFLRKSSQRFFHGAIAMLYQRFRKE